MHVYIKKTLCTIKNQEKKTALNFIIAKST